MIVIPAIHVRDAVCIQPSHAAAAGERLRPGDPLGMTRGWTHAGFHHVHVFDADAESNAGSNASVVEDIIRESGLDVQVAGGVRSAEQVQQYFDAGATSVVVSDRAFEEPEWLANLSELFPGTIVVATDVRERRVATRGWVRTLPLDIFDVVDDLNGLRLGGLLVRQSTPDQRGSPFDLNLLEDVADAAEFPIFAGCGTVTMNDLRALEHRGITGAVIDVALYSGDLDARTVAAEFGE
jgi:phosphoribosylformimino-5-aminoimidazole carboxamide ribotide isomerase